MPKVTTVWHVTKSALGGRLVRAAGPLEDLASMAPQATAPAHVSTATRGLRVMQFALAASQTFVTAMVCATIPDVLATPQTP